MDLKFWIWLLIIVVTLIVRATKKMSPPPDAKGSTDPVPDRKPERTPYREATKPMTFEELLQEIQGSKQPKPVVETIPATKATEFNEAKTGRKILEDTNYDYREHDTIYDIYDNAKRDAFTRPSLEETLKLEDTVVRFNPFKGYQPVQQRNYAAELAREIRNPSGFKKAFIMSEILRRRF